MFDESLHLFIRECSQNQKSKFKYKSKLLHWYTIWSLNIAYWHTSCVELWTEGISPSEEKIEK